MKKEVYRWVWGTRVGREATILKQRDGSWTASLPERQRLVEETWNDEIFPKRGRETVQREVMTAKYPALARSHAAPHFALDLQPADLRATMSI